MSRAVEEWVGKTDDTPVPPRVRLRVFERFDGRCYRSKRKINPGDRWDLDHVLALANGGENRESNLAPILLDKHKEKTREDMAIKKKTVRTRSKHIGARPKPKRQIRSAGFRKDIRKKMSGEVVPR